MYVKFPFACSVCKLTPFIKTLINSYNINNNNERWIYRKQERKRQNKKEKKINEYQFSSNIKIMKQALFYSNKTNIVISL